MRQHYLPHGDQAEPGNRRRQDLRLLALLIALAPFLILCALLSLIARTLLFWLVVSLFAQVLGPLFVPCLVLVGICALCLLLFVLHRRRHFHSSGQPKDGNY